jgi:hypothetical protein
MKILRILVILGILFSYIPMFPMDDCQEENHAGNMNVGCGYSFHCPFLSNVSLSESITLPYLGQVLLISTLPAIDELPDPIFHPPKI